MDPHVKGRTQTEDRVLRGINIWAQNRGNDRRIKMCHVVTAFMIYIPRKIILILSQQGWCD
jgi:hypothetical protein